MNNLFSHVLLSILVLAVFSGCSKDDNPSGPSPTPSGSSELDGTDNYSPTSKGSTWEYTGNASFTVTVIGDSTYKDKQYRTTLNSGAPSVYGLMRREKGIVYTVDNGTEHIILKETTIGDTWSYEQVVNGFLQHYTWTLAAKEGSRTVKGKTYNDVLRAHVDDSIIIGSDTLSGMAGDYYFARGVGMIEIDLGATGHEYLNSYSIK